MAVERTPASGAADPVDATPPGDRIDRFVAGRLQRIAADLPPPDRPLAPDLTREIEALSGLSRLREQHIRKPAPPRATVIPVVLVLTGIIVTLAVFLQVRTIAADVDIKSTAVTFRSVAPVVLTAATPLHRLVANAFAPTEIEEPLDLRRFAVVPPVELRPAANGVLMLTPISIPAGATVSIQKAGNETWQIDISQLGPEDSMAVNLAGPVAVSTGTLSQQIDFSRGVRLELSPSDATSSRLGRLGFSAGVPGTEAVFSQRPITIDRLAFEESGYEAVGRSGPARYSASAVLAGTVINQSVGAREMTLRPRTRIDWEVVSGQINGLRIEAGALHVAAAVTARDAAVGFRDEMSSLHPSWLEWIAEHHTLKFVWGSAAWVLAVLIGGIKWWRKADID
jgi:hypothetical protein